MSDYYDFTDIHKNKFKKTRLVFPLAYLKEIMKSVFQMFIPQNLLSDIKNGPIALYDRLFGYNNRRQIFNVLVLVADLETNVGAACIELLNNEAPELMKHFNYRQTFPFFDDNFLLDDFMGTSFDSQNDQIFNFPAIENICPDIQDESIILDANLGNDDQIDTQINPDYLMQVSLTSNGSAVSLLNSHKIMKPVNNDSDSGDLLNVFDIKQENWNSFDAFSFTEVSTSGTSCEWADKENNFSEFYSDNENDDDDDDDEDDEEEEDFESDCDYRSLPKPIKREINQLRMLGVPYDYRNITQSSHEQFKVLRSNPGLNKSQIALMVSARRRYINRKAATRCRTQKVQQKDELKIELKKLQDQLARSRISLTKAYQERNKIKDTYREAQRDFISRLESSDGSVLSPKRWTTEFIDDQSLIVRENV